MTKHLLLHATIIGLLLSYPIYAREGNVAYICQRDVSNWLQRHSVRRGEPIEVKLENGTTLKCLFVDYALDEITVTVRKVQPKNAVPQGNLKIDYVKISKFSLSIGKGKPGLALLGGIVGFQLGALPGMAIVMNDYGTRATEKLGGVIILTGGILGARWGSNLGARDKITVEIRP